MSNILKATALAAAMLAAGLTVSQAQQANPAPQSSPQVEQDEPEEDGWFWGRHGRHHGGDHASMGEGWREGKYGHGQGPGGKGRGMMMIDANGDGVIGAEEASAMADMAFARMDADSNDALSEAEFSTPPGRRGGWRGWFGWGAEEQAAVAEVRKQKFAALDADKNGSLSRAEFFADAQAKLAAADSDKDGKVTPWEFRAMGRP